MKKLLLFLFVLVFPCSVNAQVPGGGGANVPVPGSQFSCSSGTCTSQPDVYVFVGPDGSTQAQIGTTNSAADFLKIVGGISGAGATLVCSSATDTDVSCNITATGHGSIYLSNGSGVFFQGVDPGAPALSGGQVQVTPATATSLPRVGNSTFGLNLNCGTGLKCQVAGQAIQTAGGVYAFNVNGDFQIDQPNEGSSALFGSGRATDGWFGASTFGSVTTFVQSTTVPTGFGPYYTSGSFTNGSAHTVLSTSRIDISTRVIMPEIAALQMGTSAAQASTLDICMMSDTAGLTYPAQIPVFLNNNAGGSNYRSFVHLVTLSAVSTWTCTSIAVPGDTTSTGWGGVTSLGNRMNIGVSLGCGSNFQTSTLDAWVGGTDVYCTSTSTALTATASARIYLTGVHLRLGNQNYAVSPFQSLPYETELIRARQRYWKTFANGAAPVQNKGAGTGEIQFPAAVATTGTQRAQTVTFPPMVNITTPAVTFFNPSAANANCRDETVPGDGGAAASSNIASIGANSLSINCTGNASTAVGNLMGVHVVVDGGI